MLNYNIVINSRGRGKKVSVTSILFVILFVFTLVLFGGNTRNPDYMVYEYRYNSLVPGSHTGTLLYGFQFVCNKLGCSFQMFRALEAFIGLFLLSRAIKHYTSKPLIPYLLYIIYPFLLDVVQVGNFLSYTIVVFSLKFLEEDSKKGAIKYIVSVYIASQFHILAIVYMVFLLSYIKNPKTLSIVSCIITASIAASVQVLPRYVSRLPIIGRHTQQLSYYLTYSQGFKSGALAYAILLIVCYFFYAFKISINKNMLLEKKDLVVLKVLSIELCFVPLMVINSEFIRTIRNLWILYYIVFWKDLKKEDGSRHKYNFIFKLLAIILGLFLCYKELSPSSFYYNRVTKVIFENNIFW